MTRITTRPNTLAPLTTTQADQSSQATTPRAAAALLPDFALGQDVLKLSQGATNPSGLGAPSKNLQARAESLDLSTYTVQDGDTFDSIAGQYGISTGELIAANPTVPMTLEAGTVLTIPDGTPTDTATGSSQAAGSGLDGMPSGDPTDSGTAPTTPTSAAPQGAMGGGLFALVADVVDVVKNFIEADLGMKAPGGTTTTTSASSGTSAAAGSGVDGVDDPSGDSTGSGLPSAYPGSDAGDTAAEGGTPAYPGSDLGDPDGIDSTVGTATSSTLPAAGGGYTDVSDDGGTYQDSSGTAGEVVVAGQTPSKPRP